MFAHRVLASGRFVRLLAAGTHLRTGRAPFGQLSWPHAGRASVPSARPVPDQRALAPASKEVEKAAQLPVRVTARGEQLDGRHALEVAR